MKKIEKEKIKTWFVTGASSGVGHELCKQLLERGYNVIAVARRVPDFRHENALCLSVDVTKPETIHEAIKKGIERFGKIDVLSNNAGISANVTCEEETLDHMKQVMDVNFFGTFNTINALLPHFRKNKNGTIINNSSMHGISIRYGGSAYCASKHAIEGLTDVCRYETQKFCRVMAFELGWFQGTGIGKDAFKETQFSEYKNIGDYYKKIYYIFDNNLPKAINTIINQSEYKNLPRRLMLGKDACIKTKAEINYLKMDFNRSKKLTNKCSKYKFNLIIDLLNRFYNKILKRKILHKGE